MRHFRKTSNIEYTKINVDFIYICYFCTYYEFWYSRNKASKIQKNNIFVALVSDK